MRTLPSLRHHPRASLALAGAALADTVTFLVMGVAHELNPIAVANPPLAIVAKAALVAFILLAPLKVYRFRVMAFGAFVWSVGALSNIRVIGGL